MFELHFGSDSLLPRTMHTQGVSTQYEERVRQSVSDEHEVPPPELELPGFAPPPSGAAVGASAVPVS